LADASDKDPVATLIGMLAIANIVVGVRYHSAVLRLAAGRHPFHLHYSRKGEDLSRRLGLDGCAIDAFDPDAAIPAIEATAQKAFNVRPISEHVRSTFAAAMEISV
jgi:polysaccharide pyruvyl transferase WcaK-like protein